MTSTSTTTDEGEATRVFFDRSALDLRTFVAATVTKVYPGGKEVDVQPDVSKLQTLDDVDREIRLAIIPGVPVLNLGDVIAGLFISVPLSVGTEGWLLVADRPLDTWQHGEGTAPPPPLPMLRHHDLTDSLFLPTGSRSTHDRPFIAGKLALSNRDGSTTVEIDETTVLAQVSGGASMLLDGDAVTIDAALTTVDGNMTITGELVVAGSITAGDGMFVSGGTGGTATITGNVNITGDLNVSGVITGGSFVGDNT